MDRELVPCLCCECGEHAPNPEPDCPACGGLGMAEDYPGGSLTPQPPRPQRLTLGARAYPVASPRFTGKLAHGHTLHARVLRCVCLPGRRYYWRGLTRPRD